MKRRDFLKHLAKGALASPFFTSMVLPSAVSAADYSWLEKLMDSMGGSGSGDSGSSMEGLDFTKLASLINLDPACLQYVAIPSPCCPLCPNVHPVTHFLPVLFIEAYTGLGDSVFAKVGNPSTGTRVNENAKHQGFEVRVWEIPKSAIKTAMAGQSCRFCDPERAVSGGFGGMSGGFLGGGNTSSSSLDSICGFSDQATSGLLGSFNEMTGEMFGGCAPKLLYDSEFDYFNWRTGCRDLEKAAKAAATCAVEAGKRGLSNIGSSVGMGGGMGGADGSDECLGQWGGLYPRQMTTRGHAEILAAAKTAYRGLHVAKYEYESVDYEIEQGGKLQFVYPDNSECMIPGSQGSQELESELNPSDDGLYGFLWWTRLFCCKTQQQIAGNCTGDQVEDMTECLGGG